MAKTGSKRSGSKQNENGSSAAKRSRKGDRAKSSSAIQSEVADSGRDLATKRDVEELRKEEAKVTKKTATIRRAAKIKKRASSVSLLSYLLAEEVIHASKIEEGNRPPSHKIAKDTVLSERKAPHDSLVVIRETDTEQIPSSQNILAEASGSSKADRPSSLTILRSSEEIMSRLIESQPRRNKCRERVQETTPDESDDDVFSKREDELLLGYRNMQTKEIKIAAIPPDSFEIFEDEKETGREFTIVVKEQDLKPVNDSTSGAKQQKNLRDKNKEKG